MLPLEASAGRHRRQGAHLGQNRLRQLVVNLDQSDRIATGSVTPNWDGADVDSGLTQDRREFADKTRLVEVGDVDHRGPEFGVHPNALDVDDSGSAIGKNRSEEHTSELQPRADI